MRWMQVFIIQFPSERRERGICSHRNVFCANRISFVSYDNVFALHPFSGYSSKNSTQFNRSLVSDSVSQIENILLLLNYMLIYTNSAHSLHYTCLIFLIVKDVLNPWQMYELRLWTEHKCCFINKSSIKLNL